MRSIAFVLPLVLPSLNTMLRQHWSKRRQHRNDLVLEVIVAIGGPRYLPRKPFAKARVSIVRHSPRPLDTDGAYASVKNLVDVMCAESSAHPYGLGIIEDDAP